MARAFRLLILLPLLALAPTATAAAQNSDAFAAAKCARYRSATEDALRRWGREGLSAEFLAAHSAFIAGGCQGPPSVCPRPGRETDFANAMTVRAMNAGMASTFLPWACR